MRSIMHRIRLWGLVALAAALLAACAPKQPAESPDPAFGAYINAYTGGMIPEGTAALAEGMALRVSSGEYTLSGTAADEYGRSYGLARVELPDGVYDGTVVTEQVHPISFLLESR